MESKIVRDYMISIKFSSEILKKILKKIGSLTPRVKPGSVMRHVAYVTLFGLPMEYKDQV